MADVQPAWTRATFPLTRAAAARYANVAERTIDRARMSGELLWHRMGTRGVGIWPLDLWDWIQRGRPTMPQFEEYAEGYPF